MATVAAFDPTTLLANAALDTTLLAGGTAILSITVIKFSYKTIKGLLVKGA